ncbi:hypothetical protein [Caulobacter sp. SSI4214]|jgi:hypothetical protein|nr:hypothetical protein [Caulobacter sp. SSI4214]
MPTTRFHPRYGSTPVTRRFSLHRPIALGAAVALWAAIIIAFRLLTI